MGEEPQVRFPPDLPITARLDDIAAALRAHQVVIVAGETGSGKTTQLPKLCLALGRGRDGMIGHTQPRRIAARSVAERIAAELNTDLGDLVGYQVRFTSRTSPHSRIKLMTDGILLAELPRDRDLRRYDTIIIDEAHERSLNIDFLVGYLKQLLPRRPDLKVIITSATIDPERFATHFRGPDGRPAPIIEVSGRTFPVEVRYRPLEVAEESRDDADQDGELLVRDQTDAVGAAVDELAGETPGDILVFLPGEREIRDTADVLAKRARGPQGFDIVPLYGRLSAGEQHRVFERHSRRRIVLSTNIAETSLTVPGITAVIDTGVARMSRWSTRTKVQRLPIEPISQASAGQRSGRCGRVAPGIAIRLYSQEDFASRPEFTEPEILRTGLASVILQMASLGLGEITRFPFLDPPDTRQVRSGQQLLFELGALKQPTGPPRLTRLGRQLSRLPIDPQLGRMLLAADRLGCLREVVVIAAALSVQDPRERPSENETQADQAHARFADDNSDFLSWLNLWDHLRERQRTTGSSAFRRYCRENYLNYVRIREWQDLESQLREVTRSIGLRPPPRTEGGARPVDAIHQALLTGLLSHIGLRDRDSRDYLGARGARFAIFPGSVLFRRSPDFVMAAELVETTRLWGRQCARIDPGWVERAAGHLVKRTYSEPRWSKRRAAAVATERVTLYGVPLVADRTVAYAPVDPIAARDLFIRHALVAGEWNARHAFLAVNRRLLEEAGELEQRSRRHDLVVDDETLVEFYDRVLPPQVVSGSHFDGWWKQQRRLQPELLTFDPAMLLHDHATQVRDADFPQHWETDDLHLALDYRFDPAAPDDGVTVELPLASLAYVDPATFSWHVPGLRHELVVALIRSLPKQLRVNFVPVPDVAAAFLREVPPSEEALTDALARYLRATTGVVVPPEAWDYAKVAPHLRPTFRVVDPSGHAVATGKDLAQIADPLRPALTEATRQAAAEADLTVHGATDWTFGNIPETFTVTRAGHEVRGFPTLTDERVGVGLDVVSTQAEQGVRHRLGVRRLLALNVSPPNLLDNLDNTTKLLLAAAPYPTTSALAADCVMAALTTIVDEHAPVRDEDAYRALLDLARNEITERARSVLSTVLRILDLARRVDRDLHGRVELDRLASMNDMRSHLARLLEPGFVAAAGARQLAEFPRYLAALGERRRRLDAEPQRDQELMARVAPYQRAWENRMAALPEGQPPLAETEHLRWLVEEFRVSLWAQQLGTAEPVSEKRLNRLIASA